MKGQKRALQLLVPRKKSLLRKASLEITLEKEMRKLSNKWDFPANRVLTRKVHRYHSI